MSYFQIYTEKTITKLKFFQYTFHMSNLIHFLNGKVGKITNEVAKQYRDYVQKITKKYN